MSLRNATKISNALNPHLRHKVSQLDYSYQPHKTTQAEYREALAEAEGQWEDQSADPKSEAKQLADALAKNAPKPRKRRDGLPVASEHKRGLPLSPSAMAFIKGVIRGQSLRTSYREGFKNATGSDASISASANKLMKDPIEKHRASLG